MVDCLFCKIAEKSLNAYILYEDDASLAFLDIHPHAPGHTLVIPKSHAENLLDLPEKEIAPLFSSLKKVVNLLDSKLKPEGFTIGINQGQASGQTVQHLHVNVLPRFRNDGGGSIHSVINNPPTVSLEEMRKKIIS